MPADSISRSCMSPAPQLQREQSPVAFLPSKPAVIARSQIHSSNSAQTDISEFESYMPSHAVGLCRWEGRPLWRALRFTIGRAFTPTLQCYLGTVPCILDGFRLFIVQFFGRPAPSDLGGACIVSRSYPRQFTDFLLLRIRMRFPVPSPAAYRAGLFLYECRRCEPN